jgi:hypothetical protein
VATDGEAAVVVAVSKLCVDKLVPVVAALSARLTALEQDAAKVLAQP